MKKLFFILILLFLNQCQRKEIPFYQTTFFAYDTVITISIEKKNNYKNIIQNIHKLISKYELIFNIHNKNSLIYKVKTFKPLKQYKINKDLLYVLKFAKKLYKESNGFFDPTIGILNEKYNFNMKKHSPPNVKPYMNLIGFDKVKILNNNLIVLKKGITIDLSGISKGYIIDKIKDYLKSAKIKNFLINIGGDIYAGGHNPDNRDWVIGIQHPIKNNKIILKKKIYNEAIATSGDYERYFFFKGKRYFHILNPFTGLPAFGKIKSVTVISKKAMTADALATTIFLLGEKKSENFIKKHYPDIKYIIIKKDLTIISNE